MPILYMSHDNGQLYEPQHIEANVRDHFTAIEVPEVVSLTAKQLCAHENFVEILLAAKQARIISP